MRLVLQDKNQVAIATKELANKPDFDRLGDADTLMFQGSYYGFVTLRQGDAVFQERSAPVIVDGFVDKLPQ